MGQYYVIVNIDKKEFLDPSEYGCGAKLTEFSHLERETGHATNILEALHTLIKGRWQKDRVYVVGDYADIEDENVKDVWYETMKGLYQEIKRLGEKQGEYEKTLFDYAINDCKSLKGIPGTKADRFLCNAITREYVDLRSEDVKICRTLKDGAVHTVYHPLPLLLAMGNGQGGGDYYGKNDKYVGSWVPFTKGIFFSDSVPDSSYTELCPCFEPDDRVIFC